MGDTILKMTGITKYIFDAYGKPIRGTNVKILDEVSLDVREGEVHILIGENGAGKSTLMKILGGIIPPDEGTVELFGKEVHFKNPREAESTGISFIHQELNLCPNLSVGENLFLGREIKKNKCFTDKKAIYEKSREMLMKFGFKIDSHTLVRDLSTAQQQIVEIVKAISYNSRIVIMDEPTASLTEVEIDHLFEIIRTMQKQNISVIYISHRFEELKEIGDQLSVMRDGKMVGTIDMADFSQEKVIKMMVGRTLNTMFIREHLSAQEEVLRVEELKIARNTKPISIQVKKGEVVGIGGLVGAGRTEFAKSIFGVRKYYGGRIIYRGKEIEHPDPRNLIRQGFMYLSEDRKVEGLILRMDIEKNITLSSLPMLFPNGTIHKNKERKVAISMIDELNIVCRSEKQMANTLSGGNQQKVVLAKWLAANPSLMILDEPTRGIDINAKSEIYKIIDDLTRQGVAILMISSELAELIGISDRIYVMKGGSVSAELTDPKDFTQEKIMSYTV